MKPQTHEHDPEAAWRSASSAGQPTQFLPNASGFSPPAVRQRNNLLAWVLLVLGAVLLVTRLGGMAGFGVPAIEIVPGMVLFTIASCFLFFAFWQRIYGLLIPGCILAGLSLGVTFVNLTDGASILWGLSLGFVAIYLLGRDLFNQRSIWPVFPAVPLFAVGTIVAIANASALFATGLIWLPLLLIAAGLVLGVRR
jgi:hypothetical protein